MRGPYVYLKTNFNLSFLNCTKVQAADLVLQHLKCCS
jgi:hypothetical protein